MADVGDRAEVRVVSARLFRDQRVQRVVEVVAPLRVQPEAAFVNAAHDPRIVEVALASTTSDLQVLAERVPSLATVRNRAPTLAQGVHRSMRRHLSDSRAAHPGVFDEERRTYRCVTRRG